MLNLPSIIVVSSISCFFISFFVFCELLQYFLFATVFTSCNCIWPLWAPVLLDFYWDSISPQPYDIPCLYHFTKLSDGSFCLFFGSGLNSPKEWLWFAPQNKVTHTVPFFFITSGKWQVDRVTASKCSVRSHHSSLDLIFLVDTLNV